MVFRNVYNAAYRMYRSFFYPPSIDLAIKRRQMLSYAYAFTCFLFFVYSSYHALSYALSPEGLSHGVVKSEKGKKVKVTYYDSEKSRFLTKEVIVEDDGRLPMDVIPTGNTSKI